MVADAPLGSDDATLGCPVVVGCALALETDGAAGDGDNLAGEDIGGCGRATIDERDSLFPGLAEVEDQTSTEILTAFDTTAVPPVELGSVVPGAMPAAP